MISVQREKALGREGRGGRRLLEVGKQEPSSCFHANAGKCMRARCRTVRGLPVNEIGHGMRGGPAHREVAASSRVSEMSLVNMASTRIEAGKWGSKFMLPCLVALLAFYASQRTRLGATN